jgi:hypothetical protein
MHLLLCSQHTIRPAWIPAGTTAGQQVTMLWLVPTTHSPHLPMNHPSSWAKHPLRSASDPSAMQPLAANHDGHVLHRFPPECGAVLSCVDHCEAVPGLSMPHADTCECHPHVTQMQTLVNVTHMWRRCRHV